MESAPALTVVEGAHMLNQGVQFRRQRWLNQNRTAVVTISAKERLYLCLWSSLRHSGHQAAELLEDLKEGVERSKGMSVGVLPRKAIHTH